MSFDLPGFADPVTDAQICFRALLDGLSRPGSLHRLDLGLMPPASLSPAAAAALLTLVDAETPLWLDDSLASSWDWLAFHCGALRAGRIGEAAFAAAAAMPDLADLATGSDTEPETSATLILEVTALGRGRSYRLAGPGLKQPVSIEITGLPPNFVTQWAANHALFPRGVDLVLCAGEQICALPRSVRIEEI
jgi:alpha-D-ribose 1-methylphosphonate 5-triphosphate synthase subunit PhnH